MAADFGTGAGFGFATAACVAGSVPLTLGRGGTYDMEALVFGTWWRLRPIELHLTSQTMGAQYGMGALMNGKANELRIQQKCAKQIFVIGEHS